jgi:sec-independent protein translocase protein TatA
MGISLSELLVVFAIIVLLFGTKKLSTLGSDLGSAIKGFRKAMNEPEEAEAVNKPSEEGGTRVIESGTSSKNDIPKN